jgi:hypothetical protein
MSDEDLTPPEEEISAPEGSIATMEDAIPEVDEPRKVPERDLLRLKDDRDRLKSRVKELEAERDAHKVSPDVESLSAKYPDVDVDFLRDVALMVDKKAEEKVAPLFRQTQAEKDARKLDTLIEGELSKADVPDKSKVDLDLIKILAVSPKFRTTPVKDLIERLYKTEEKGRATTENDMRPATDLVSDVVDTD